MPQTERDAGVLPDERLAPRQRALDVALDVALDHLLEPVLEGDVPLRVVRLVRSAARRPPAADVAQAGEPLANVERNRAGGGAGVTRPQAAEEYSHLLERRGCRATRFVSLARVRGEVVELGEWRVEELEAVPQDAVDRRPAPRERGGQRFEIAGRRVAGFGTLGCGEEAPAGEPAGTGSPTASRIVGRMSTWRALAWTTRRENSRGL